jgi:hypothetical protein
MQAGATERAHLEKDQKETLPKINSDELALQNQCYDSADSEENSARCNLFHHLISPDPVCERSEMESKNALS